MNKLSDRLNRLSYSQTFVMSNKARDMKAAGIDVISLTLGEPDFDVPANIKQAAFSINKAVFILQRNFPNGHPNLTTALQTQKYIRLRL